MAERLKDIRIRTRSVASTKKITRTMELVATSKMKRAQDRVNAASPYQAKLHELLGEVVARAGDVAHPLIAKRDKVSKVAILLVTANRGLCGGYNANAIRTAKRIYKEQQDLGREVSIDVVGKKGMTTLRFQGYKLNRTHLGITDRPALKDAQAIIEPLRDDFLKGQIDELYVVWTHWKSLASQAPKVLRLLPIEAPANESGKARSGDIILDPSPEELLGTLLPMYLTQSMYTFLVEANASEQVARRTAMKSATDNASEMITGLTRKLNRARQAQITQEIAEVVGGAAALE
ncbi:MAG: ATP synthase F1 subunit gamma [Planctomycetes bacterium]|nr:ATP synthase F1 subunit gamma [Planctomycetota bacterium]NUQ34754.1 ATP synthase F1 subunit gamma [Planctomycetaceae bacterium]